MAREKRRLAAIVCADVVGFSRLVGMDEADTLARLRTLRRELIDPKIAESGGRIVKTTGDGLLVEFGSVVDAVRCAVAVQQEMAEREAEVPLDRRIEFRFGVHMGDIVIDGDDILGDGVNVAARLEALGDPGGVCVSGRVQEDLAGKLELDLRDGGEQSLKNIVRPVRVWRWTPRVSASTTPAPIRSLDEPLTLPDKPSIAVLPFNNMSGDPEQEYFADGVVEDIITGLSRLKWLFVIARNSSFTYRGRAVDLKQIGRDLGVRYVLEGSMRKASNRVRVTSQVIETETGRHVWAERYDRTLEDIFALQDELTTSVVAAIEPSLRQAEIERVKRKRPDSLDAYDFLLRALSDVYPAIPERARKALPHLHSAIALEADYALAHGYAAWCHEILFVHGGAHEEDRLAAIRHAHAAIESGRDDALALALGGFALGMVAHDREAARRAFEAALALSPSCSLAYAFGSVVAATGGEAERGISWGETALRLSPIDPMRFGPCMAIAYGQLQRGNAEAAAEAARKCFQAHPNWSLAHMLLAATHARLGRSEAASEAARRLLELDPAFNIARLCAAAGLHPSIAGPLSEALRRAGLPT
jgi:TolB-like protein/class 3 adenylate cyclase